jgi:thioredoxin reductase (NADPH)
MQAAKLSCHLNGELRPLFDLYTRTWCHLCEDMYEQLKDLQMTYLFEVRLIDVDLAPDLETLYGELVPVLKHGDFELCHYYLDKPLVTEYLTKLR